MHGLNGLSVPDQCKTQNMCETAVKRNPYAFEHQTICDIWGD